METQEIYERQKYQDPRIFHEIHAQKKVDNSFTERGLFGFTQKYDQSRVREIYFDAMALGMQRGIEIGAVKGQRIDLFNNCKEPRQKEFLEKFYKLAEEYNCAIVYHPHDGMCVLDLNRR